MRITEQSKTLRARFGMVLTVLVWLVCAASLVTSAATGMWLTLARFGPLAALVAYAMWLLFWSPSVTIALSGVEVRNVLRAHAVTWPAIRSIDTKYALTLLTTSRKVVAWAAPAPSRYASMRATGVAATRHPELSLDGNDARPRDLIERRPTRAQRSDLQGLPDSTYFEGTIRPSDIPSTDSGLAALYVRRYWEELREAGHLDDARVEGTGVTSRWLLREAAVLAALAVLAAACIAFVR